MPDKLIVVINYESYDTTLNCLISLKSLIDYDQYLIAVVDNSEKKYNRNYFIAKITELYGKENLNIFEFEDRKLLNSKLNIIIDAPNHGFAHANNVALQFVSAATLNINKVWLLNNDCIVTPNAGHELSQYLDKNAVAICGSKLLNIDGSIQAYGGGAYSKSTGLHKKQKKDQFLDYVSAASCMINSSILSQVGFLEERYFLYYEEWDFAIRAKYLNLEIGYCPDSVVTHIGSTSIGYGASQIYYSTRSNLLFYLKYFKKYLLIILIKKCVQYLKALLKNDKIKAAAYKNGIVDGLTGNLRKF